MSYPTPQELRAMAEDKSLDIGTAWNALAAAAERIETLEADCASLKQRAWRAESRADEKWGLRKELAEALGVSDKCDDEALRAGLAAIRRLENERDDAVMALAKERSRKVIALTASCAGCKRDGTWHLCKRCVRLSGLSDWYEPAAGRKLNSSNASLDRPAASAGTVGGVVGLLPVGLIPIPPMILQEANRRAMENGDLTFGHGCALGLALCATWGLCAVAIWIKRAIVRRFHKANPGGLGTAARKAP